jgi:ABC-type multidrug transport system ATPase subunit
MDQKLKNYSSGMQVRLAFSVAIHAHAPILLLDEVLAVGDASFQRKCQKVFLKLKEEKRTIVFVTHDMNAVKEYCDRAILISNGKIVAVGSPDKVANEYLIQNGESEGTEVKNINNEFVLREVLINGKKGSATIPYGTNLEVQIKVTDKGRAKKANVHLAVLNEEDQPMMTATSTDQKEYTLEKETIIKVLVSEDFAPGNYHLALSLHDTKKGESYYGNTNIGQFKITSLGEKNSNESTVSWN